MNEYQKAAQQTLEDLHLAAVGLRGKVLDKQAVRHVMAYIQNLHNAIEVKDIALMGCDNMLASYINEYGERLMNELIEDVEGEVIYADETTGSDNEDSGLDSPSQEEE